jgi:hypothetical protein
VRLKIRAVVEAAKGSGIPAMARTNIRPTIGIDKDVASRPSGTIPARL